MTVQNPAGTTASTVVDKAREYRWRGGNRPALVQYLVRSGIAPGEADQLADRIDLQLGIDHGHRPADLSAAVAARLDELRPPAPADYPVPDQPGVAPQSAPVPPAAPAPSGPMSLNDYLGGPTPNTPASLTSTPVGAAPSPAPVAGTPAAPVVHPMPAAAPAPPPTPAPAVSAVPPAVPRVGAAAPIAPEPTAAPVPGAPSAVAPAPATASAPLIPPPGTPIAKAAPAESPSRPTYPNPPTRSGPAPQTALHAPRSTAATADAEQAATWSETTGYGYKIAESWDPNDPNAAIHSARHLARQGKTQEEIIEYLLTCNVTPGEAAYVAAESGARSADGAPRRRRRRGFRRAATLAIAMIIAGLAVAWVGYEEWQADSDLSARALGICAVGAALVLNGLRTLVRRRG